MDDASCSRDVLLAWINHRLEVISEAQHRLAVDRAVLQEQATRLRLGVVAEDVRVVLKRAGVAGQVGRRLATRHKIIRD